MKKIGILVGILLLGMAAILVLTLGDFDNRNSLGDPQASEEKSEARERPAKREVERRVSPRHGASDAGQNDGDQAEGKSENEAERPIKPQGGEKLESTEEKNEAKEMRQRESLVAAIERRVKARQAAEKARAAGNLVPWNELNLITLPENAPTIQGNEILGEDREPRFRFPSDFLEITSIQTLRVVGPWLIGITSRDQGHVFDLESGLYRGELQHDAKFKGIEGEMIFGWDTEQETLHIIGTKSRSEYAFARLNHDGQMAIIGEPKADIDDALAMLPNGFEVLLGGRSKSGLSILNLRDGSTREFENQKAFGKVRSASKRKDEQVVAFNADGSRAAIAMEKGGIVIVDIPNNKILFHFDDSEFDNSGAGISFGAEEGEVIFLGRDYSLKRLTYDEKLPEGGAQIVATSERNSKLRDSTFERFGDLLWISEASKAREVAVYDAKTLKPLADERAAALPAKFLGIAYAHSTNEVFVSLPNNREFEILHGPTLEKLSDAVKARPELMRTLQPQLALSYTGDLATSADIRGAIRSWSLADGSFDGRRSTLHGVPVALRYLDEGSMVAAAYRSTNGYHGATILGTPSRGSDFASAGNPEDAFPYGQVEAPFPDAIFYWGAWWRVNEHGELEELDDRARIVRSKGDPDNPWVDVALTPSGRFLLLSQDGVQVYSGAGLEREISGHGHWSYDQRTDRLLLRNQQSVRVVTTLGELEFQLTSPVPIQNAASSGNGQRVCSVSHSSSMIVWDLPSKAPATKESSKERDSQKGRLKTASTSAKAD